MACPNGSVSRMADNRVSIRTSDVLEKLAAARAARIVEVQQHAYRIDPGMQLARGDHKQPEEVIVEYVPDRTMPEEKSRESLPPPTSERVFDAFDIWAGRT